MIKLVEVGISVLGLMGFWETTILDTPHKTGIMPTLLGGEHLCGMC